MEIEEVTELKYLAIIRSVDITEETEIQNRMNLGNRSLFAFKIKIYEDYSFI